MLISDLGLALPGLLVLGIGLGYAVATACVPDWRWWERLACSPGLSAGAVGIVGLVLHDAGIPFRLPAVFVGYAVIAALAMWRVLKRRRRPEQSSASLMTPRIEAVVVIAGLAVGTISVILVLEAFGNLPLPIQIDPSIHGRMAAGIARVGDTLPALPSPADSSAWTRPRTGFEALVALVSQFHGPSPAGSLWPVAILAVLLIPLGLPMLALEGGARWQVATMAPFLTLAMPFVVDSATFGIYPQLVDATLVAPLAVAATRFMRKPGWQLAIFIAVLMAAIWAVHGSEAVTAVVIGGPLVFSVGIGMRRSAWPRRAAALLAASGAGAVLVTALTRLPNLPPPVYSAFVGKRLDAIGLDLLPLIGRADPTEIAAALIAIMLASGVTILVLIDLVCLIGPRRQRQYRWASRAQLLIFGISMASLLLGSRIPGFRLLFPWSVTDRLVTLHYWVLPIVVIGALVTAAGFLATSPGPSGASRRRARAILAWSAVLLVVLAVSGVGIQWTRHRYQMAVRDTGVVTQADMTAMSQMSGHFPTGAIVLTDASQDAGMWVEAVTPLTDLMSPGYGDTFRSDLRVVDLANACTRPVYRPHLMQANDLVQPILLPLGTDQRALPPNLLDGIDAVYAGARHVTGAAYPWNTSCLNRISALQPVIDVRQGQDEAIVYRVKH